jgi:hypothetical protein
MLRHVIELPNNFGAIEWEYDYRYRGATLGYLPPRSVDIGHRTNPLQFRYGRRQRQWTNGVRIHR